MEKINYWEKLQEEIERGKKGLNTGIPFNNFNTLSEHITNIQQGRYDLIMAGTNVGKTAFVNGTYVFGAIDFLQNNPGYIHNLNIQYYSLEMPPEDQLAKHIAGLIWKDYGILTNINEIKSKGKFEIRTEIAEIIDSYKNKIKEIQEKYITFRTSLSPKSLFRDMVKYAETQGTIIRNDQNHILDYIPDDPALITLIIIDHIGLINYKDYKSKKEAIDMVSRHLVKFRNTFKFSPVVISQINRTSEGMDRRENDNWHPMLSDAKDSGNTQEDANTVIALADPYYYKVSTCLGYDITKYKNRYRLVKILKNRDGKKNLLASFLFIGEYGGYYQLPHAKDLKGKKPEELKKIDEYYAKRNNLEN